MGKGEEEKRGRKEGMKAVIMRTTTIRRKTYVESREKTLQKTGEREKW